MAGRGGCLGWFFGLRRDGRMRSPAGAVASGPGREKAPPTRGRWGLKIIQKTKLIIRNCYLLVKIFNRNLIFSYACVSFLL